MKKIVFFTVVILFLGVIGWQIQKKSSVRQGFGPGRRSAPVAVDVSPVRRTSIRNVGLFTGSLAAKSSFIVAPKISGRLEKLYVNIGDTVQNGQVIAVLDDDEYRQQVDQVRAELEVARANLDESRITLEIAKREFERTAALRKKQIASESELDTAKAQYNNQEAKVKVTEAQVEQKQAAMKAAQIRLSYARIQATWEENSTARVVGERFVDEGAMLAPNTPIVSILDIHSVTAVIYVIERDYSLVTIGKEAVVKTDAFPGKEFAGRVVRVAPLLKETSRQARVEIEIPNSEGLLKPGMFVRVMIAFEEHGNTIVVPISALVKREDRQGVFVVDPVEKKARFVPVTPGIVNGNLVEILDPGLSGSVVTLGHHLLEDGSPILLAGEKPVGSPGAGGGGGKIEKTGEKMSGVTP